MLLALAVAVAAEESRPFVVTPYAWIRPSFAWRQDDEALVSDTDGFSVAARAGLEGAADRIGLRGRVEVELQPEPVLKDAFVNWTPHAVVSVNTGQMKVPFSVQQLASDTRRQFPLDAPLVDAMEIGRDMGVSAEGRLLLAKKPRLSVTTGVFNGEGANRLENVNDRFMFAQRVVVAPLGMRERPMEGTGREPYFHLGGGWVYNYTGADATAEESNTLQAEVQFAFRWVSIQGEFADREVEHGSVEVADYHATAAYGQLGCFIPVKWAEDHIEVVGRGAWTEPNDALAEGPEELATLAVDAGLNVYVPRTPKWMHDVKLGAAFRHNVQLEGTELDDDRLDVSFTVRF